LGPLWELTPCGRDDEIKKTGLKGKKKLVQASGQKGADQADLLAYRAPFRPGSPARNWGWEVEDKKEEPGKLISTPQIESLTPEKEKPYTNVAEKRKKTCGKKRGHKGRRERCKATMLGGGSLP